MEIMVIGGGIGGLTAALALHRAGIGVRLFESVSDPKPMGVGINLLPHCVRVLDGLNVLDPLLAISVLTKELVYFNRYGQEVWREPRGTEAGYKWPQLAVHRGQLQMLLMTLARERLGDRIVTGHHFVGFEVRGNQIVAQFTDRATGRRLADQAGDALIGADGIHSAVRAQMFPGEGPPKWNGAMQYRGVCKTAPFLSGRSMFQAGGDQTFLAYPILLDGELITNWVARFSIAPANAELRREDWNKQGRLEEVLPRYSSWRFDWFDVPALIQATDAIYEFPMVDRDPLERWTYDRVTLLGDAAHPMYPLGSNGAGQAILDAQSLANAFGGGDSAPVALKCYESERRPMSSEVVLAARRGGPERMIRLVEERAPAGFDDLHAVVSRAELAEIAERYKRVSGFDVDTVNR